MVDLDNFRKEITPPLIGVIIAFFVIGIFLVFSGTNPLSAYLRMFTGSFGSIYNMAETLAVATPLLLAGLGIAIALKTGYVNLGVEGQLLIGAIAAAVAGLSFSVFKPIHLTILIIFCFAAGAAWSLIPGILREKFGSNELITGLLLNFVALYLVNYLVEGPLMQEGALFPQTARIHATAMLPRLLPRGRLHMGFIIAIIAVFLTYIILRKSVFGYELQMIGENPDAALRAGIDVSRKKLFSIIIAGGLAGLAGMGLVLGVHRRLMAGISPNYGYLSIAVALLGRLKAIGIFIASILFAAMLVGGDTMSRAEGVSFTIVYVLQGLIIIFLLLSDKLINR